jgi:AcrR family transcriptional regulator
MAIGSRTKNRAARAEKALATRRRITAAATELFIRDGYLQTTMADIARLADVAVQTLYLSFGSKVALLSAALDVAIAGDDQPVPVLDRPWFARLRAEPDPVAALGILADSTAEIIDRVYPLHAAMSNASADPELAQVRDRNKSQRFASHLPAIQELASRPDFNPQLPVQRATEIFYALMSEETYGLLVAEHGWTTTGWSGWALHHIRAELFPDTM